MNEDGQSAAVLWDFDGTLVDTLQKNLNVTRKIIQAITDKDPDDIPALRSLEEYELANRRAANWRELYTSAFGLSEEVRDMSGTMWAEFQLEDTTPTPFFDGVEDVIKMLSHLPQGIVSQNARSNIAAFLEVNDFLKYFRQIVGYEEVALERQKPQPDGVMICLEKMAPSLPQMVFYVGDHETDARCVSNCNQLFANKNLNVRMTSIGAFFGSRHDDSEWTCKPDYCATDPHEIFNIVSAAKKT